MPTGTIFSAQAGSALFISAPQSRQSILQRFNADGCRKSFDVSRRAARLVVQPPFLGLANEGVELIHLSAIQMQSAARE